MAINKVNTETQEQDFRFLTNQSSILHTVETNDITVNGVNVIVDKPKRGDVMYISNQKVIWIDGLSINPKQLPQEYEPVGICLVVNGNKALVRYREEQTHRFMGADRFLITSIDEIINYEYLNLEITLNGNIIDTNEKFLAIHLVNHRTVVNRLNEIFKEIGIVECSAEITDENGNYPINEDNGYIVINYKYTSNTNNTIKLRFYNNNKGYRYTPDIQKIYPGVNEPVNYCYRENGFKANFSICCKAKTYDWIQTNQRGPAFIMTSIDTVPDGIWKGQCPVRKIDFNENVNCEILRDTFANYDEYLNSMMIKYPCGAGGAVTKFPSGKKDTYELSKYTYYNCESMVEEPLYPAAYWASSISLDAPNLGKGNWWLPSISEMVQIMRDITYDTSFWESKPDIINIVLAKLTSINNSGWSMLSAYMNRWTSSGFNQDHAYSFNGFAGILYGYPLYWYYAVAPITIYEFE